MIYLKNIPAFYSIEHNPYVCLQGSGYEFKAIIEIQVQGKRMYKAKMMQGNSLIVFERVFTNQQSIGFSLVNDVEKEVFPFSQRYGKSGSGFGRFYKTNAQHVRVEHLKKNYLH